MPVTQLWRPPLANINVDANDPVAFWRDVSGKLASRRLSKPLPSMIIVCEGDRGWDNYLLLHHFHRTQKLDDVEGRARYPSAVWWARRRRSR